MSIKRNIAANYAGTAVSALLPVIALPWYLLALGSSQWGLVSFVGMLVALLGLLDAGLGQALVRELALRFGSKSGKAKDAAVLLYAFERVYWLFSILAAVVVMLSSQWISSDWLKLGDLPPELGLQTVWAAALLFALQFPGALYRSALIAFQAQVALNRILIVSSIVRHAGCIFALQLWPSLWVYLLWQVVSAMAETYFRRRYAWSMLDQDRRDLAWDGQALRRVAKQVVGMSGAVLLAALTMQLDKIFLSRMVALDQFGYYAVAASLAIGALQLIYPVTQAVMPRLVTLQHSPEERRQLSLRLFQFLIVMSISGVAVFFLVGEWVMVFWLRDPLVAEWVLEPLRFLLLGTLFNALSNVGYLNWVAKGRVDLIWRVNLVSALIAVSSTPFLIARYGIVGASTGWLAMSIVGFVMSLDWLKREPESCAV